MSTIQDAGELKVYPCNVITVSVFFWKDNLMYLKIPCISTITFIVGLLGLAIGTLGAINARDAIGPAAILIASAIVVATSMIAMAAVYITDKIIQKQGD